MTSIDRRALLASMGAFGGTGYGPGSDSSPNSLKRIGTLGWCGPTTAYGIP